MKSSRAMLLAAFVFVAPAICSEQSTNTNNAPSTTTTTTQTLPAEAKSWLGAAIAVITGTATSSANFVSTPAAWFLQQFTRISYLKGSRFENNIPVMSKVITAAAIAVASYTLWEAYQDSQDDAGDDEQLFVDME